MSEIISPNETATAEKVQIQPSLIKKITVWILRFNTPKEDVYLFLKTMVRVEMIFIFLALLFYAASGLLMWKIDTEKAGKMIRLTNNLLAHHDTLAVKGELQALDEKLDTTLAKKDFIPFSVSNFYTLSGNDTAPPGTVQAPAQAYTLNKLYQITSKDIGRIQVLDGFSRSELEAKVTEVIPSEYYNKYSLDQFLLRGNFGGDFSKKVLLVLLGLCSLLMITYSCSYYMTIAKEKADHNKLADLHTEAQASQQALLVWDLAQQKLNRYYDRNLNQNNSIFIVAIVVMVAGFAMVLYGISLYFNATEGPHSNTAFITGITTASGTIVQFIGATFLVIYNSTIKQAIQYTNSLQRISTIGTSIKILDAIGNDTTDKDNAVFKEQIILARISIAKMLINPITGNDDDKPAPAKTSAKAKKTPSTDTD